MRILLVNDDGISSPGLRALARALSAEHEVLVVAPDRGRSAAGHSITMTQPIMVKREDFDGITAYSASGTPADCTRLGLFGGIAEQPVDLVISGPNYGYNLGTDVLYSGTVSAALEGAMHGVKAIAVSSAYNADFEEVAKVFVRLLKKLDLDRDVAPALNVNIPSLPADEIDEAQWAPPDTLERWATEYERRLSPYGQEYFWISFNPENETRPTPGTDRDAVEEQNKVALTGLSFTLEKGRQEEKGGFSF